MVYICIGYSRFWESRCRADVVSGLWARLGRVNPFGKCKRERRELSDRRELGGAARPGLIAGGYLPWPFGDTTAEHHYSATKLRRS